MRNNTNKNFDRTEIELQEYFLYCISNTSVNPVVHTKRLENFLAPAWFRNLTPFEYISYLYTKDLLRVMISDFRLGESDRLTKLFIRCTEIDLETISLNELENIPGIGPKIARKFILNTRPNQDVVLLDPPILLWLHENTTGTTIPKATPESTVRYNALEALFLQHSRQSITGDALVS